MNLAKEDRKIAVKVRGGSSKLSATFRTTDDEKDLYKYIGDSELNENDVIFYEMSARSAATFFAK